MLSKRCRSLVCASAGGDGHGKVATGQLILHLFVVFAPAAVYSRVAGGALSNSFGRVHCTFPRLWRILGGVSGPARGHAGTGSQDSPSTQSGEECAAVEEVQAAPQLRVS